MSALMAHAHACRAISAGYEEAGRMADDQGNQPIGLAMRMHAYAFERAAGKLIDQAKAEMTGEDRRGEKPLGRKR